MDIKNYVYEYIRITLSSIKNPEAFFRAIPDREKDSAKPAAYLILSLAVGILFRPEASYLISRPINSVNDLLIYFIILWILFLLIGVILIPSLLYISLMHFVIRFFGGRGKIEDTFMVFCYSVSPLNFIWILNFLAPYYFESWISSPLFPLWIGGILYMLFIMIAGISVRSGITKPRAFGAAMAQTLIIILVVFIILSAWSYQTGTDSPVPQEYHSVGIEPPPQRYNLTTYLGYAPVIDGMINGDDLWKEGMNVQIDVKGISYVITTKHDRENLYILMHWKGPSVWSDRIMLLFKQDDGVPDFNMNTGRVDMYSLKYEPAKFEDWHFVNDFTLAEHQDGSAKASYNYNINEMVIEWKIPLNSGDNHDIYINKYPARLGFSIVSDRDGGIFPAQAHQYDPATWADLEIVDIRKT